MALSKAGKRWYIPPAPKGVRPGCLLRKPPDGIIGALARWPHPFRIRLFREGVQWFIAGWSSPVARQAHNLKVTGSNPVPATKINPSRSMTWKDFSFVAFRSGVAAEKKAKAKAGDGRGRFSNTAFSGYRFILQTHYRVLAAGFARGLLAFSAPSRRGRGECRVSDAPAASRAKVVVKMRASIHSEFTGIIRHPPRNGLRLIT
jgi:hypothetical protein